MRIGGASRDSMMTVIPVVVAVFIAMVLLGGPDEALRAMESVGSRLWAEITTLFRR